MYTYLLIEDTRIFSESSYAYFIHIYNTETKYASDQRTYLEEVNETLLWFSNVRLWLMEAMILCCVQLDYWVSPWV